MPELPEVENYRKYLQGTSLNQTIVKVEIDEQVMKDKTAEFERENIAFSNNSAS